MGVSSHRSKREFQGVKTPYIENRRPPTTSRAQLGEEAEATEVRLEHGGIAKNVESMWEVEENQRDRHTGPSREGFEPR